jgi:predicted acylesterase/phospholipase RssA
MSKTKTKYFQNCLGVFQGGGCKGIAFAGAYQEAYERGVFFSELVGASAGSIVAVLIGAGATPQNLLEIMKDLNFSDFKRLPVSDPRINADTTLEEMWSVTKFYVKKKLPKGKEGYFDKANNFLQFLGDNNADFIGEWVNKKLCELLKKDGKILFSDLKIPTHVIATDLHRKKVKVWNNHENPDYEVAKAVQASCSIPFFFQPFDLRYVDGGLLSNLPAFVFETNSTYNKVLGFSFKSSDCEPFNDPLTYANSIVETAIDGSMDIQLKIVSHTHLIKIDSDSVKSTDFDSLTEEKKNLLIENGKKAAADFFDHEIDNLRLEKNISKVSEDIFDMFNRLVSSIDKTINEVLITDEKTIWAFSLFPLFFKWVNDNAVIKILLPKNNLEGEGGKYRRDLLTQLGCIIEEKDELPFKGFILNGHSGSSGIAVILNDDNTHHSFYSKTYSGEEDREAIKLFRKEFFSNFTVNINSKQNIKVNKANSDNVIDLLKKVNQYSTKDVQIRLEKVEIDKLIFLTKYIKGYKFRSVKFLFDFYDDYKYEHFIPLEITNDNGFSSIITPPVVEKTPDGYIVYEGNARFAYGFRNQFKELLAFVIYNVKDSPPSTGRFKLEDLIITDVEKLGASRYEGFIRENYRNIEKAIRNPNSV